MLGDLDIETATINIMVNTFTKKKEEMEVTSGVRQGAVLGPTLLNIYYDEVLRMVFSECVRAFAFADDLAVLVSADSETYKNYKNQGVDIGQ